MRANPLPFRPQPRFLRAAHELVGGHHLGDDETGPEPPRDPPESHVGDAGQRRKKQRPVTPSPPIKKALLLTFCSNVILHKK